MARKLRVLIADDHQQCRWVVAKVLSPEFDLVGAVANGHQLIAAAMSLIPDVIVADISMPLMTGIQAMAELKSKGYTIPFVLISSDPSGADEYIRKGAMAFVSKIDMGLEIEHAVSSAYVGRTFISRTAMTDARTLDPQTTRHGGGDHRWTASNEGQQLIN